MLKDSRPFGRESPLVEAGGQLTRSFRAGLDYAFILAGHPGKHAERVIRRKQNLPT